MPELISLLSSPFGLRFVLQLVISDTTGAIKLTEIFAGSSNSHPLFDFPEGIEGNGSGSRFTITSIESVICNILVIGHSSLSTLGRTGGGNEIAQLILPERRSLLSLHSCCVGLLHQIGCTAFLPLHTANVGCGCMEERGGSCGRDVVAEDAEERGAMVGVDGKGCHQLCSVFSDLREGINVFLLIWWLCSTMPT